MTEPVIDKATSGRARPLAVEDRQAMIIDAITPLLIEHGREVTSRQIAEAAGVAEGTIFRAFGDKDSLIDAAVERLLDPEPMRRELRGIDTTLAIEEKLLLVLTVMQERFGHVFRVMTAVGHRRPPTQSQREEFARIVADILAPDLDVLAWPTERVAHIIRMIAFSTAFPQLNHGIEFAPEELTALLMHGIIRTPTTPPQGH